MNRVPKEILIMILKYIPPRQILKFLRVNRQFNDVITRNSKRLPKPKVMLSVAKSDRVTDEYGDNDIYIVISSTNDFYWKDLVPKDIFENITILSNAILFNDIPNEKYEYVESKELATWMASTCGVKLERREFDYFLPIDDVRSATLLLLQLITQKLDFIRLEVDFTDSIRQIRHDLFDALQKAGSQIDLVECGRQHSGISNSEIFYLNSALGVPSFKGRFEDFVDDLLLHQGRFAFCGGRLKDLSRFSELIEKWKNGHLNSADASFLIVQFPNEVVEMVLTFGADFVEHNNVLRSFCNYDTNLAISRDSDDTRLFISIWQKRFVQIISAQNGDDLNEKLVIPIPYLLYLH